ncbi:hypothetical protein EJB05_08825, partial [Eragrostis curvula]
MAVRPPGPLNLPLIGSLHHLVGSHPQVALRDLANKHGPVMFLRMGQFDTVVISSAAAAKEVLQEKDVLFASRPNLLSFEVFSYGHLDLVCAPYGQYWRMLRKLCMVELLSGKVVRQLTPVRNHETLSMVRKIQEASQRNEPVNLGKLLMTCSSAITAKAAFGQVCSTELQEQFLSAMEEAVKISGGFSYIDLFPSLEFLDVIVGARRRMWQIRRRLDAVFDKIIALCDAQRGDDLVSILLRIKDEGNTEFPVDMPNIRGIILDMFTAGTETTSSAAEWVMSELIRHPEVMAKVQDEVRRVFHNKRPEDHQGHLDELPYMRMVIKESMRLNPVIPLLVPHLCRETCDICGFEIKEGTRVIINAFALATNPEYWPDAEKFRPERFEDGKIDYKTTQFEYLPFGAGRRRCPGDTFGLASLELIVARLLYYFDWSLPGGMQPDEFNMDMSVGATMRRKDRLQLMAAPHTEIPTQS